MSKKAIARTLDVSCSSVAKYARDHGIDMSNRYKASYYSREPGNEEDRDTYYRRRFLEELEATPIMSCKDLKERVPGAYNWLLRKDPEWIHARLIHERGSISDGLPEWRE